MSSVREGSPDFRSNDLIRESSVFDVWRKITNFTMTYSENPLILMCSETSQTFAPHDLIRDFSVSINKDACMSTAPVAAKATRRQRS